jgi:hypothetical protein
MTQPQDFVALMIALGKEVLGKVHDSLDSQLQSLLITIRQ